MKIGPWYSAALGSVETLDALEVSRTGAQASSDAVAGAPHWTRFEPSWNPWSTDGSAGIYSVEPLPADFLATTIQADRPVTLTFELSRYEWFGGFAYRPPPSGAGVLVSDALIWLNGQQVELRNKLEGYQRVPVAKRRGWHERFAWHDAVLVDLTLQPGENHLVVTLRKQERKSWFSSVRFFPQPAPALWPMIENDFPRSGNRLLESVDASWFDAAAGWFSQGESPQFERQLVEDLAQKLGPDGATIRGRLDALVKAQAASSDIRWLTLCITAAELHAALGQTATLRAAVEELYEAYPQSFPGARLLGRIAGLRERLLGADGLDPAAEQTARLLTELEDLKHEALVAENPLLAGKRLLFVKRFTYDSDHYYDEFITGTRKFGGGLFTLSLSDGAMAQIAPALSEGVVDRYDLSFDGRRIIFDYKHAQPEGFRLYEVGVDGTGLRQITFPPPDEGGRIATYCTWTQAELQEDPWRYGHWTDDMHPCYLPDGGIAFTSSRSEQTVLCGGHALTAANLHRVEADGSGLRRLSQGALSEFCPTMMNDGRILYNRWEYVDKGAAAVQSLWAMYPDGGRPEEIYGNNIGTPPVFNQAKQVPGRDNLLVCLGAAHAPGNMGAILLIDRHKDKRSDMAMTALTPGSVPKGNWGLRQFRNGRWIMDIYGPWYCDPFPLAGPAGEPAAGKFFLVSCNPEGMWNDPAGYGIYLLDVFGNRVPIYRDPQTSCWQARPLEPREVPLALAGVSQVAESSSARLAPGPSVAPDEDDLLVASVSGGAEADARDRLASVLVSDVYEGLDSVARGTVKYLRIMEQVPRPWSVYLGYQPNDAAPGQMVAISLYSHLSVKVLHGVVPVLEDGSACFTVPAGRNIFLQALDADFMEVQRMRTFVNFQPGERRSCIGCHEQRNRADKPPSAGARFSPHRAATTARRDGPSSTALRDRYPADLRRALCRLPQRRETGEQDRFDGRNDGAVLPVLREYHRSGFGRLHSGVRWPEAGSGGCDGLRAGSPALHIRLAQEQTDCGPSSRTLRRAVAPRRFHPVGYLGGRQCTVLRFLLRAAEHHLPRPPRFPPRADTRVGVGHSARGPLMWFW